MNIKKALKIGLFALIALISVFTIYCWYLGIKSFFPPDIKDPVLEVKTDTVYVPEPFEVPKPYPQLQPPEIITEYDTVKDYDKINELKLKIKQDSLIITGLKKDISIHEYYLKQYPKNPKLLSLWLNRDELTLSLLEISGNIKAYQYPISTDLYKYRWADGNLSIKSDPLPKKRNPINYYLGFGGMVLQNPNYKLPSYRDINPYLSFKIDKRWARNNIYFNSQIGLLKNNPLIFQVGLERNLRKK